MSKTPKAELSFGFLIGDVSRSLRRDFERRVDALGLTMTQWRAIAHLLRHPGINQAMLAEILEVTPITLTRLIDRMEDAGWIERQRDPNDRRAVQLHLTPAIQPLLDKMHAHANASHDAAFAGISKTDETKMQEILEQIKSNLTPGANNGSDA